MRRAKWLIGLSLCGLLVSHAQRLEGWDVRTDSGTRFDTLIGSGIASFQWGQLRGNESVPPRTARHAYIRNIRVVDGGDPFGRVAVLWSGWEPNGGDRTEFWLRDGYKRPPLFEPAQVGQVWSGDNLFRIRMWNEQYFSWQPRSVVVSVYAANAPTPRLVSHTPPSWADFQAFDRMPNRPGIQIDPYYTPSLNLWVNTGSYLLRRPLIEGLKRVVGLDNYATESRPSPFRDDVFFAISVTTRINGTRSDSYSGDLTGGHTWSPNDASTDRSFDNFPGGWTIPLSTYPRGTRFSFDLNAQLRHIPYNKDGQALPLPTRRPVDDLRDADRLMFDLRGLTYTYSGAVSGGGSVSDGQAPPTCITKSAGTLDIVLNLQDFGLPYNLTVALAGRALADDVVEWTIDTSPNLCLTVEGVQVKVKRVWGKLTARLIRQPFFYDPTCGRTFNLTLSPINGDTGNWLNGELYALCQEASFTRVNVQVRAIGYDGASGLDYEPPDPRWLFQFTRSQWVELILHGDVDGSGCVDDNDLLQVLFQFGQGGSVPADQNGDGIVDDADVLIVLLNFGRCY